MIKILVTGGAGFLGSNLCRYLVQDQNIFVYCLDNLYCGKMRNIDDLLSHPNFKFLKHDIIEPIKIEVDEIYNAACPASLPNYQKSPTFTMETCTVGMLNMLKLAHSNHAKILQFSTSEIYGEPAVHPQCESYNGNVNPVSTRSCYAEGKRCAEALCFAYRREYGVRTKVIRIFNTYGPYMASDDGRVVSNFIMQALQNKDITMYGDGSQTRSFCYVDDLIKGIVKMMESPDTVAGPVNLGNPGEFTVKELAEMVMQLTGSSSRLTCKPLPEDDPVRRKPDASHAAELLGWKPEIDLKTGLQRTIEYFRCL